ncbi:hypothetical protein COLO4_13139 [Corchorus olitorius]|uniref:Uncharacterized protein n=1 Tax=Corchorus olitorius TaxID=93759 RepID=A0A1R3JXV7_9ROSI|nr:hypothetical protein COLO4_13139 [Corchorus olitorius]
MGFNTIQLEGDSLQWYLPSEQVSPAGINKKRGSPNRI